jgi:hypothetical protein
VPVASKAVLKQALKTCKLRGPLRTGRLTGWSISGPLRGSAKAEKAAPTSTSYLPQFVLPKPPALESDREEKTPTSEKIPANMANSEDEDSSPAPLSPITTDTVLEGLVDEIRGTSAPIALDTETYDPTGADEALDVRAAKVRLIQIKTEDGEPHVVDVKAVSPALKLESAIRQAPRAPCSVVGRYGRMPT